MFRWVYDLTNNSEFSSLNALKDLAEDGEKERRQFYKACDADSALNIAPSQPAAAQHERDKAHEY